MGPRFGNVVAVADGDEFRIALARGCRGLATGDRFDEARARNAGLRHFVPIGDAAASLGVLGIAAPARGELSPGDRAFLDALCGLAASGLANARAHGEVRRLNARLDQKIQELRTLHELARALSSADGPDEVGHLLGLSLAGQWATGRWAVFASRAGQPPGRVPRPAAPMAAATWPRSMPCSARSAPRASRA